MRAGIVVEEAERQYWLVVEQDGDNEEKNIKWLPRDHQTARVWQLECINWNAIDVPEQHTYFSYLYP